VVLKVSPEFSWEAHRLAQLQHTNIVPIHSVHRDGELQAVCMPFFGRTTLADVIDLQTQQGGPPMSGRALLDLLADRAARSDSRETAEGGLRPTSGDRPAAGGDESLARLGRVDACLWIAARLADALAQAHRRGILHRDLKPANILLTDEGQPMILDFNLSHDVVSGGRTCLMVGGTLPYMAPEHLRAIESGESVDERADIYSLGVILFEMLTGQLPFPKRQGPIGQVIREMIADRQPGLSVRQVDRTIPRGVDSIVRRCLAPQPGHRYRSAGQLHQDLQCHLNDLPLRHTSDRSVAERMGKWIRRHPRLTSATTMALISAVALATVAAMWGLRGHQIARLKASAQFQRLNEQTTTARAMLSLPDPDSPGREEGTQLAYSILRNYGLPEARQWRQAPQFRLLDPASQRRLTRDLGAVLYLLARPSAHDTSAADRSPAKNDSLRESLRLNELARRMYQPGPPPRAVQLQHADLLEAMGQTEPAKVIRSAAMRQPTRDPGDQLLLAVQLLRQGEHDRAVPWLERARDRFPEDFSVWLLLGNALAATGHYHEAEGCFTTCVALCPESYLGYFHRGLCRFELGKYRPSRQDFDETLRRRPRLPSALVNRALAHQSTGELQDAERDLTSALEAGATETRIYFVRARIRQQLGDLAGAEQDRREGLRRQPRDEKSWIARGIAKLPTDPQAALADFRQALQLDPRSQAARQNVAHVLAERMDQTGRAIAILGESLDIRPDDPAVWIARGVLHARQGDRDEAISDAQQALRLQAPPDMRHQILYQAGCVYALTSADEPADIATAVALIAQAIRLQPKWSRVAATDPDLGNLRADENFRTILSAAETFGRLTRDQEGE
jgi:serine/threonine protein kinase/Flp pilus assembly protein TadD